MLIGLPKKFFNVMEYSGINYDAGERKPNKNNLAM